MDFFRRSSQIYGLELFAILDAVFQLKDVLGGKSITIFCDNEAAAHALVKGDSSSPPAAAMIALFWLFCERHSIAVWIERAPSGDNLADLPTRDRKLPIPIRKDIAFYQLKQAFKFFPSTPFSREYLFRR